MTFDAESKCGVDAFLTLKVNAQKYGVNFFRKYVQIREIRGEFLIPKMTKVTKILRRCDERDRIIALALSHRRLEVSILKTSSQSGKPLNLLPKGPTR